MSGGNLHTITVSKEGKYQVAVKMSRASNDIYVSEPFNLVLPQGSSTVSLTTDYDVVYKINNTLGQQHVLIYPNPASGSINIENAADADVSILNETGQIMYVEKKIGKFQTINIPELKSGVYFVKLSKNNSILTERIVVLQN